MNHTLPFIKKENIYSNSIPIRYYNLSVFNWRLGFNSEGVKLEIFSVNVTTRSNRRDKRLNQVVK